MTWAMPPVAREQLVLFPTSLDEVVPQDHLVRVLDELERELQQTFAELERQALKVDAHDNELLGSASLNRVSPELAKTENPLAAVRRAKCLQAEAARRTLSHDQYEPHRVALRERMAEEPWSDQLTRRQSEGERPFAVIKQQMSLRQLLLRGHEKVTKEWHWMKSSANTQTLIRWCRQHRARLPKLLASFAATARSRRCVAAHLCAGARASPSLVGR